MKKHILVLLLLVISTCGFGQSEVPDSKVFTKPELVWCGIDFSQVKCIGAIGFNEPDQIKDRYFSTWNQLVLTESKKFDVQKFYAKKSLVNDLSVVNERNKEPKASELVVETPYTFKEGQLSDIVKTYSFNTRKDGLGVVYVVESLNKLSNMATIHVTFFDLESREIYWTKKYTSKPEGFGFRNFWAGAIFGAMEASQKDYAAAFKKFKKQKS